jgi:uncharacterized protein YndB with AHSA1/START domain
MTIIDDKTVSVSTEVDAPIGRAFHVFTAEIDTWWDADKHLLQAPLKEMVFEPWVGGHIIDRGTDGSECRWARVLVYEPPTRVVFSWDINTRWQVETDPSRTSEVEITFRELTAERTEVVLTHRHLDRHGEGWESMRDAVGGGWSLAPFALRIGGANHAAGHVLPIITDAMMHARLGAAAPYTAALLFCTDKFVRPAVNPIVWEHGRRNMALAQEGVLAVVLPVGDDTSLAGIGVFAASAQETAEILNDDPGVRAGIFSYELHPVRGFPGATLPAPSALASAP